MAPITNAPRATCREDQLTIRRFPQPVQVGNLIGLRVLDHNDLTIGIVCHVVRTTEGKIQGIICHSGPLGWGGRLVAVPIEAVAIFGRQLASSLARR